LEYDFFDVLVTENGAQEIELLTSGHYFQEKVGVWQLQCSYGAADISCLWGDN